MTVLTTDEYISIDSNTKQFAGWYCIRVKSMKCQGCGFIMSFLEPEPIHVILVWADKDDELMNDNLKHIADKYPERRPRIIEYDPEFGPCIDFYDAANRGMLG